MIQIVSFSLAINPQTSASASANCEQMPGCYGYYEAYLHENEPYQQGGTALNCSFHSSLGGIDFDVNSLEISEYPECHLDRQNWLFGRY